MTTTEIKMGSTITWRKRGGPKKTGRVEWCYIDAGTLEPYWRVRPDVGRRTEVRWEDVLRARTPTRTRRPK